MGAGQLIVTGQAVRCWAGLGELLLVGTGLPHLSGLSSVADWSPIACSLVWPSLCVRHVQVSGSLLPAAGPWLRAPAWPACLLCVHLFAQPDPDLRRTFS